MPIAMAPNNDSVKTAIVIVPDSLAGWA
jgi:hypothetical protein